MENKDTAIPIMISAMYENGGNTTHRLLDGHPELFVYPFESQLGTSLISDYLLSYVPFKYRWPVFPLKGNIESDYELIYDEELKTLLRRPNGSKFRDVDLQINETDRRAAFVRRMDGKARTNGNLMDAFFRSTFDSWKNVNKSGQEKGYVGYSPVFVLDAEVFFADMPHGHIIHVVRNPYSGYSDTKKRPFPLSIERYTWTWNMCQMMALTFSEKYPNNFHLVRFEDIIEAPKECLGAVLKKIGLSSSDSLGYPSWNGKKLEDIYPWGTIRLATAKANLATMNELSNDEKNKIRSLSVIIQRLLKYDQLHS